MKRTSLAAATLALSMLLPAPARAATVVVFMNNLLFCNTPVCIANENTRIQDGDTVIWVYSDPLCAAFVPINGCRHIVLRTTAPTWNSGAMPGPGGVGERVTFTRIFTPGITGTFDYFCSVHPGMRANIIVT